MSKKTFRLSEQELKNIESAVAQAEKKTSGEVVPLLVARSHDYWWVHWAYGFMGLCLVTAYYLFESYFAAWGVSELRLVLVQGLGFVFGFVSAYHPAVKRFLLPKKWMSEQVYRQSLSYFMHLGLHRTKDRTGVLIYISYLEREVEILADTGIHEKAGANFWNELVRDIIAGVHRGSLADALVVVIARIGEKLTKDFPRAESDKNELSDKLQFGTDSLKSPLE